MDTKNEESSKEGHDEYILKLNKLANTEASKKIWRYFLNVSRENHFQETMASLREKYNIPKEGYEDRSYMVPPKQWKNSFAREDGNVYAEDFDPYFFGLKRDLREKIGRKYNLHYLNWSFVLEVYVFYNEIFKIQQPNGMSLMFVTDLAEEAREPFHKTTQEEDNKYFPVALRISPYARKTHILNFVEDMYSTMIEPIQKAHRDDEIKIGKIRKRPNYERNREIYNLYQIPLEDLKKRVADLREEEFIGQKRRRDSLVAEIINSSEKYDGAITEENVRAIVSRYKKRYQQDDSL